VTDQEFRLERLVAHHDLERFESGNETLDAWLGRYALAAQRMDSARSFLLVGPEGGVIGYFSLTMGSVLRAEAPAKLVRGLPSYPIGMVLLARLAVDRRHQGVGMGGLLLAEALRKAVQAGEAAAARLVVVDAIDESAAQFYARYGFIAVPGQPLRLYRRIKDVRASHESASGRRLH
jgi:GNAT superfamily N-acetyltransferase